MHRLSLIVGVTLVLGACGGGGPSDENAKVASSKAPPAEVLARLAFNPSGTYQRADPAGRLRVRPRGDLWEVYLKGEARDQGPSTAGTCTVVAVGPLTGHKIVAKVTPFRSGEHTVTDLAPFRGNVTVTFDGSDAEVVETVVQDICGIGSDLSGRYRG